MKRIFQLGLLALGLGWALPTLAQNECGGLQVMQQTRDRNGVVHQVQCYDSATGQLSFPFLGSITLLGSITPPGSGLGISGTLTAQNINGKLCVGQLPCYSSTSAAATAAGSVNKTIIEIEGPPYYTGTDCGPAQDNIIYVDYRGMNPPCNTNNSISYNPATSAVPHMILEPILFMTSPTNGTASTPVQSSAFVTGTLPGNGGIVDGFAATAFTTGAVTGTLGTLRGAEIAASIPSGGGTVNNAQGVAGYVAGLGGATTAIGTVQGVLGTGCNIQTYGVAPTNCFGMEAANQQSKASSRNYSAGFDSLGLFLFDGAQTNGGFDCEDSSHVAHGCVRVDSLNNLNIKAIATNVNIQDIGSTTRLQLAGANVLLSTECTITQANQAGSPIALCALTSQKGEVGADANVLTFTPPALAGTWRMCVTMAVSAQNTATLGWTATWTDSNGSAQTPTNLALTQTGVAAPALTFTAATNGNYTGCQDVDINNAAANLVVKTTFTGTSIAYKVTATIWRVV